MAKDLMSDDGDEQPKEISLEQFKADVQEVMAGREKVANANQAHGTTIKSLGEERGYNMQAFKAICTLAKKSGDAQSDYLRTFNAGVAALGLGKGETADLFDAAGDEDNEKKTKTKVVDLAKERAATPRRGRRVRDPADALN